MKKKAMKKLYLLDHRLRWGVFKKLHAQIVKNDGPTPKHIDKVLWQLLKTRQIYCWFGDDWRDDMGLGIKVPEGYEIHLITNPS